MARVTVEDCLEKVENRFLLVMLAAKRVKQLYKGHGRSSRTSRKTRTWSWRCERSRPVRSISRYLRGAARSINARAGGAA